jgi:hypothetical protein
MSRLVRAAGVVSLALLCGSLLLAATAVAGPPSANRALSDPYWVGPSYASMQLAGESEGAWDKSFFYGDCDPPKGEGGCPLPLQIQNTTSCARNPIGLDRLPYAIYGLRGGGIVAAYEPTAVDLGTGGQTVTVYAEQELIGSVLGDLRRRSQTAPQELAPPVYPMPVLRELKRVTAVAGRLHTIRAIGKATGLLPGEVWVRLRVAELLGPDALADVPPPTMSTRTVERLRQLAFRSQSPYALAQTAHEEGISKASLRAKIRRVRGLAVPC